jgi:uncharacterized membrane protein (GlpM family)
MYFTSHIYVGLTGTFMYCLLNSLIDSDETPYRALNLCRDYHMSSLYLIYFNEFYKFLSMMKLVTHIMYTIHCVTMVSCCLLVRWCLLVTKDMSYKKNVFPTL